MTEKITEILLNMARKLAEIFQTVQVGDCRVHTYRAHDGGRIADNGYRHLDWIETYNHTVTRHQTNTKRSRFAVTAGVGVGYTPQGFQPMVGIQAGVILWSK